MRKLGDGNHHMVMYEIHETKHSVYIVADLLPGGELLAKYQIYNFIFMIWPLWGLGASGPRLLDLGPYPRPH